MTRLSDDTDRIRRIRELAVREFQRVGVTGTIEVDPAAELDAVLTTAAGAQYGLGNLTLACLAAPSISWKRRIRSHVERIVGAMGADHAIDLAEPDTRAALRARLSAESALPDWAPRRRIAEGLVETLCLDLPTTVLTLDAAKLAGHDADTIFELARWQLRLEPRPERREVAPGIFEFVGDSLFTASLILFDRFVDEVADARGAVFLAPDRNRLFLVPVTDSETVGSITRLASFGASISRDELPGGLISSDVFYRAPDGGVERVSRFDPESGSLEILADGALGRAPEI